MTCAAPIAWVLIRPLRLLRNHMKQSRFGYQPERLKTKRTMLAIGTGHIGTLTPSSIVSSSCSVWPIDFVLVLYSYPSYNDLLRHGNSGGEEGSKASRPMLHQPPDTSDRSLRASSFKAPMARLPFVLQTFCRLRPLSEFSASGYRYRYLQKPLIHNR